MTPRHPGTPDPTQPPAKGRKPRKARARTRAGKSSPPVQLHMLPQDDPRWRPLGPDGRKPVEFARDRYEQPVLEAFLESIRLGAEVSVAAHAIGSTGTEMRAFRRREPAFDRAVEEALAEGHVTYLDRLRATARQKATLLEGGSDRILEVELGTHVPGYEHLRRDRVKVNGTVQHEHAIVIDPAVIESLPLEKLEALREILAEIEANTVDGEARELGPGE